MFATPRVGRMRLLVILMILVMPAVLVISAPSARAQGAPGGLTDSALLAQRRANAAKILSPARYALEKKAELGLENSQITALQRLAVALDDSASVRRRRAMVSMQSRDPSNTATAKAAASWTGTIDEAGIKADYCKQSEYQAEAMLGLVRDRHMVGAILTAAQRTQLEQIYAMSVNPR